MERTTMETVIWKGVYEKEEEEGVSREEETKRQEEEKHREAVEAELARRAPSATDCGICCKSYADIAAASSSALGITAVLPCCHTVCRACVHSCAAANGVACPVCMSRFDAIQSAAEIDALPRNPFVEDAVRAGAHTLCSACIADDTATEESVAVVRCVDCGVDLCDVHQQLHTRTLRCKGHAVSALANS